MLYVWTVNGQHITLSMLCMYSNRPDVLCVCLNVCIELSRSLWTKSNSTSSILLPLSSVFSSLFSSWALDHNLANRNTSVEDLPDSNLMETFSVFLLQAKLHSRQPFIIWTQNISWDIIGECTFTIFLCIISQVLSQKKISVAFSSQPLQKDVVTIQAATHVTD